MWLREFGVDVGRRFRVSTLVIATIACGCGSQEGASPVASVQPANHHEGADAGPGSTPASSSGGTPVGEAPVSSSEDAASSEGADGSDSAPTSQEAGVDAPEPLEAGSAPCVKGQVQPNEVVMLGDSYLDAPWGNVGPTLMMEANAMYRHYYIGGASLGWGNPNTQFYIPYQFDPMALTDTSVTNPSDIKVVIMDGGGNDVLIGNTSCETTAPPANTSCVTTVQTAIDVAKSKMQEMAQKGVQSVVFFFYPHLDTAGGGILLTPAPAINDTLDYAYPLAEQLCCGSTFTSSPTNSSCSGQSAPGLNCVFIDTRPAFEGHLADYIKSDKVHPTQAGAQVISDLIWNQMKSHCIAQ
jgi:hypothetical protein